MANKNIILVFGQQGSGKSTQAVYLTKKLSWQFLSSGNTIRSAMQKGTEAGKKARKQYDKGVLVSDEIVTEIINESFNSLDFNSGVVMEGYPRTIEQNNEFINFLNKNNFTLPYLVNVKISDKSTYARLSTRKICPSCQKPFSSTQKDFLDNECSDCHVKLIIRADDNTQNIKTRLFTYHNLTNPIIDYYREINHLVEIDGEPSIDEVSEQIYNKLKDNEII